MPVYEYVCRSCKTTFEHLHRTMTGDAKAPCPQCGSKKTDRSLSVFAVSADAGKNGSPEQGPSPCGRCGGPPGSCSM